MSRSRKKPITTLSKRWDHKQEKSYRRKVKEALREVEQEIPFDPDADFEAELSPKKLADFGTKMGWDVPPDEGDDTWMHEEYKKAKRK